MAKSKASKVYTRLPMLRAERGLSRKQLADVLDVHYQTIGYIERGEFMPSLEIAIKAAQYFGLPVETVFSLEPFAPLSASNLSTADKDAKAS